MRKVVRGQYGQTLKSLIRKLIKIMCPIPNLSYFYMNKILNLKLQLWNEE
jgi:hypothetical protein